MSKHDDSKRSNWVLAAVIIPVVFGIFWVIGWLGYHSYADKSLGARLKGQRYINEMAITMGNVFGCIAAIYAGIKKPWRN